MTNVARVALVLCISVSGLALASCGKPETSAGADDGGPAAATGTSSASIAKSSAEPLVAPPPFPSDVDGIEGVSRLRDPFHEEQPDTCSIGGRRLRERMKTVAFADVEVGGLRVRGTASISGAGHAIIADGQGHSRVLHRGDKLGTAMVDAQGNVTEWTVDRIRNGDVVLVETGAVAGAPKTYVLGGSS